MLVALGERISGPNSKKGGAWQVTLTTAKALDNPSEGWLKEPQLFYASGIQDMGGGQNMCFWGPPAWQMMTDAARQTEDNLPDGEWQQSKILTQCAKNVSLDPIMNPELFNAIEKDDESSPAQVIDSVLSDFAANVEQFGKKGHFDALGIDIQTYLDIAGDRKNTPRPLYAYHYSMSHTHPRHYTLKTYSKGTPELSRSWYRVMDCEGSPLGVYTSNKAQCQAEALPTCAGEAATHCMPQGVRWCLDALAESDATFRTFKCKK